MSVRSFCLAVGSFFALASSLFLGSPVLANECSIACTATYIAPPLTGSLTSCTSNAECASFCATTCGRLTSPRATVDASQPSTCSATAPRACSPCNCKPEAPPTCEGSVATGCASTCTTTCNAYNAARPPGVASIACATGAAAPSCVPPARSGAAAGTVGFCRFSCLYGPTATIHTATACNASAPCSASALASECTRRGLQPTTRTACRADAGGNKCDIVCTRPTTVSAEDLGTCVERPTAPADTDQCLNRCQQVCGARGMECADGARCATGGRCAFSCRATTTPIRRDEPRTVCSFSNDSSLSAATALCTDRCTAVCGELGAECVTEPAPVCQPNQQNSGTTGSTNPAGSGDTPPNRPAQSSRTAPVPRVTFPDPFGGQMTVPQVIGNIVRILVGLSGIFFLGVFVYGGFQYLTSAGDPKMVQKGQGAIVNAVIGLVVVLFAYLAVSLIVQVSDQLQTGEIGEVDRSQDALDDSVLQPGGTTRATGRSSQSASGQPSDIPLPEPGTPGAACRTYYGADPASCTGAGGACPAGVSDLGGLVTTWGRSFPAATRDVPDPAAACRTCLETGVRSLEGRFPGINTSCIPALVHLWSTSCRETCNPRATEITGGGITGADICTLSNYNTTNPGCSRCISYWSNPSRASTVSEVGCPAMEGKVAVWCAGAESPSQTRRPQSGGYCTFTAPRR